MPPRRGSSPSVDPFPPLGRTSSRSRPSYASIAASSARPSSHPHRDEVGHPAWTSDDVDRHDSLDELNPYSDAIDLRPSPPWRSRPRQQTETGGENIPLPQPQAGPSRPIAIATPSGSHNARINAVANGARDPVPRDQSEAATPTAGPSRPRESSPPSPSPNRATRQEPRRLAPILTLEELLRQTSGDNEPPITASPSQGAAVLARLEARRRNRARLDEASRTFEYVDFMMERALPSGVNVDGQDPRAVRVREDVPSWAGESTATRRTGYSWSYLNPSDSLYSIATTQADPSADPVPRPLDGSGPSVTSFLRRRQRNPARASNIQNTYDPDEVLPYNSWGNNQPEGTDEDSDVEDDQWGVHIARHVDPETEAEFDVDGWGLVGATGTGSNRTRLTRGGNNRRRQSFLQRIGAPPDLRFVESEPGINFPPPLRGHTDTTGWTPTNEDILQSISPLLVRSSGTGVRRGREEEEGKDSTSRLAKRFKSRNSSSALSSKPIPTSRPSYLFNSTLPSDFVLPFDFTEPLRRSHLSLSVTYSAGSSRPLITFTGHNPSRKDTDATALRTTTPIPIECGVHYYEALVVDAGEKGFMSIGWILKGTNLRRLVGWDKGSWGWHGDDGRSFEGQGSGERFSETWTTGDIVGCGVDFTTGRAFFTKNAKMLGYRFSKLGKGLHPAIGLRTVGESLAINFSGPFKFDIDGYVRDVRDSIWRQAAIEQTVAQVPRMVDQVVDTKDEVEESSITEKEGLSAVGTVPPKSEIPIESSLKDPLTQTTAALVLDHLKSNGHDKVLAILRLGMQKRGWLQSPASTVPNKKKISSSADFPCASGSNPRLDDFSSRFTALAYARHVLADSFAVGVPWTLLSELGMSSVSSSSLVQQLDIREFLYLVHLSTAETDEVEKDTRTDRAIGYGKILFSRCRSENWGTAEAKLLNEAFGRLSAASLDEGVWKGRRGKLADDVVAHLKEILGIKPVSYVQQSIAQTAMVLQTLREKDGKTGAAFIDVKRAVVGVNNERK